MITLTAKINLLSGDNKALSLGLNNLSKNNISSDLGSVIGVKTQSRNPFMLGVSKFGEKATFSSGENYFIGDKLSDKDGKFATPYELAITSTKALQSLTISFDTFGNRHPNQIKIDRASPIVRSESVDLSFNASGSITQKTWDNTLQKWNYSFRFFIPNSQFEGYENARISEIYSIIATSLLDYDGNIATLTNITQAQNSYGGFSVYGSFVDRGIHEVGDTYSFDIRVNVSYDIVTGYEKQSWGYFQDDDAIFTIPFNESMGDWYGCYITISDWNAPNRPIVITGIYTEISIDIDRHNLISIDRSIFDRSDLKLPSFGIISNTGNIEFNDTDGEVLDYAEQLLLEKGLKCEIKLNNTLVDGASKTIALYETDQWNYDNDSRVVSVSLKDDLEEWQEINVEAISYDPRNPVHQPFSWLYEYLWSVTDNRANGNYNMLSFEELDEATKKVLSNTYTKYPLLESGTLWEQWTKLCEVCQLHIFKDNDGIIVCRYNGGN